MPNPSRLRRVCAVIGTLSAAAILTTGTAHAVDGFSQPTYSPNSNPQIHQTEGCSGLNGTVCSRWVRFGGTYMQGPHSQMDAETPLIAIKCSNGARVSGVWNWQALFNANTTGHEFCEYGSPDFWRRS